MGRIRSEVGYRYSFNGKENDPDFGNEQLVQDYGFRIYNPSIGRFLSVDPLTSSYPSWSPYPFAMNRPIDGVDLDGLEWRDATQGEIDDFNENGNGNLNQGDRGYVHQNGNHHYTFVGEDQWQLDDGSITNIQPLGPLAQGGKITFDFKALVSDDIGLAPTPGADPGLQILGINGTIFSSAANEHGMVELPHSGNEVTGSPTVGSFFLDNQELYQYYNRNDVANAPDDQWGTIGNVANLINAIGDYREIYPNDIIQIGDMRSPTNGRVNINRSSTHHGDEGAVDIRYLGIGGSYRGTYLDNRFNAARNRALINTMGRNNFTRVFVAPGIRTQVNSNNIRVNGDGTGTHDNHLHFDTN